MSTLDVLLVLRACIEHYPPSLNQANILAASGLRVGVIDLSSAATSNSALNPDIQRWQVHWLWDCKTEKPLPLLQRWNNGLNFRRRVQETIRTTRPKVVIGYDITGCAHLHPGRKAYRSIFHFHELPEKEKNMGLGTTLARLISIHASRKADLVVFPDYHRAVEFQRVAGLAVLPKVVMNCPVKLVTVPVSPLSDYLRWRKGRSLLSRQCGLEQSFGGAAHSMRYWPANARWVIIGASSESVRSRIMAAADLWGWPAGFLFGSKAAQGGFGSGGGRDAGAVIDQVVIFGRRAQQAF